MKQLCGLGLVISAAVGCGSPAPTPASALVESKRFIDDLTVISGNRPPDSAHWQVVQNLCADRFAALGYEVERHAYATGVNVIGVLRGTKLPAERIVVSAHYDSVNNCAGTDDNGSGVAGTLEAARVLALQPHDRTLVVACWDEEEAGLIGSRAYAMRAKAAGDAINVAYSLEMIGYRSSVPNSQRSDAQLDAVFPDQSAELAANDHRGDFILIIHDVPAAADIADFEKAATELGLPTIALSLLEALKANLDQLRRSDHASFWDAGYPAVMLGDTGDFRNPHYHCAGGSDALADIDVEFATMNIKATVSAVAAGLDR